MAPPPATPDAPPDTHPPDTPSHTIKTFRVHRRGKVNVVPQLREQYLQSDLPWRSALPPAAAAGTAPLLLPVSAVAAHFADCLDLLAPAVHPLLFQTCIRRLPRPVADRLTDNDALRVFPNEHFASTYDPAARSLAPDARELLLVDRLAAFLTANLAPDATVLVARTPAEFVDLVQSHLPADSPAVRATLAVLASLDSTTASAASAASAALYPAHATLQNLEADIANGKLLRGTLWVPRRGASSLAFVVLLDGAVDDDDADAPDDPVHSLVVLGQVHRNRAVHGDVVAVQIVTNPDQDPDPDADPAAADPTPDDDDYDSELVGLRRARVAGIVQRNWRTYVATLQEQGNGSDFAICIPMDHRIPKIRISTRQHDKLRGKRILVRIDAWGRTRRTPDGHFVRELGPASSLETEAQAILLENGIRVGGFPAAMLATLPQAVPTAHLDDPSRRDLRDTRRIMSVDPPGCQDIDDALSVHRLDDGLIELGVHIADVTAYVDHDSPLDKEARQRGTTLYLVDQRLDMLPAILSENLCSLREHVDRLAFSVLWTLDPAADFAVRDTWFGRTIIRSAGELAYQDAQSRIDAGTDDDLATLLAIGQSLHRRRLARGAIELDSAEVRIQLDRSGPRPVPVAVHAKQELPVHQMVAELMIFANEAVAAKIFAVFPQAAILRSHARPDAKKLQRVTRLAAARRLNVPADPIALAAALRRARDPADALVNRLLRLTATTAMEEAQYVSSGGMPLSRFGHYGLGAAAYTHFTSPIRRYADIVAHRQLLLAIERDAGMPGWDSRDVKALFAHTDLTRVVDHLNDMNRAAKHAQMASTDLFRGLYFAQHPCQRTDAVVCAVHERSFSVYVPAFGLQKRVDNVDFAAVSPIRDGTAVLVEFDDGRAPIECALFDRIAVAISAKTFEAHPPKVRIRLIEKGASEPGAGGIDGAGADGNDARDDDDDDDDDADFEAATPAPAESGQAWSLYRAFEQLRT